MSYSLSQFVVETQANSWTGYYLYSDFLYRQDQQASVDSTLNKCARIPVIGILAGIARMALAIIHTIGHLFAAAFTLEKGHLYHALKGCCEFIRGMIEATPIVGRVFSYYYSSPSKAQQADNQENIRSWWIIKMYNPHNPDPLDRVMQGWGILRNSFSYIRA